eukprot:m.43164 g.43164  ORF g.43164 m.43164 type:complete len:210 (-) comp12185_c0_seq1:270-899(-)
MDKSSNISVAKGMEPQLTFEGQTLKQPGDPAPSATSTSAKLSNIGSSIGSSSTSTSAASGPTDKDVAVASAMEPSLTSEGATLQQPGDSTTTTTTTSTDKTLFGGSAADGPGAGQVRPGDSVGSVRNVNTFGKDAREKLDDTADSAGDKLQGASESVTHFVSQAYEGAKAAVEKIGEKITGTTNAPTPDEELQMKVAHDPAFKANSNDI